MEPFLSQGRSRKVEEDGIVDNGYYYYYYFFFEKQIQ